MPKLKFIHAFVLIILIGVTAAALVAHLFPAKKNPGGVPVTLTGRTFNSTVGSGVHLVDFWADWCGPCHMQAPIIDGLAKRYAGIAGVGKLNIDSHEELAKRFSITSIPTLILFKDGKEERRFVGVQPEDVLVAAIDEALP